MYKRKINRKPEIKMQMRIEIELQINVIVKTKI